MIAIDNLPSDVARQIREVSQISQYLWDKNWAERNAGNISIDLSAYYKPGLNLDSSLFTECPLPIQSANLTLFVTGKGCHLRHLILHPEEAACILQINDSASGYHILWGGQSENFRPTSELITHLKIHHFNATYNPAHTAVLHTHPLELIVLSHHKLFLNEKQFNHSLWKMCPEIRVFVPRGIHCAPYALTGSDDLANITINGLKDRDIILWEKHGALACGRSVTEAFDFLDVANKGAKMLLMAWAAGFEPRGLSEMELKELEKFI